MTHKSLINDEAIEEIKKQGCCLGKYRIMFADGYYCFLEGIFDCPHQNKKYVKIINAHMLTCKTNSQVPGNQCDIYLAKKAAPAR